MPAVTFEKLDKMVREVLIKLGLDEKNAAIMADIYMETTKRGVGHHDIYNLPSRLEALKAGKVKANPAYQKLSSFGVMERWDGDNGLGELINTFSMQRAVDMAKEHGMGLCTMRNSNHYLCSAPFVSQAAKQGCIGIIIAKGVPTMGVPGTKGNIVGQSPIGFAFPTGGEWPVMLDICLAYASGEQLMQKAKKGEPVPGWWGVDKDGNPAQTAMDLLKGTKYPIGEHKGFGLAILCELLTGVLSGGEILDENADQPYFATRSTSHTAIAIKADALMQMDTYEQRSSELIERLKARSQGVHIPGEGSWKSKAALESAGAINLTQELCDKLNMYAMEFGLDGI
jgi:LDH2 family malate/lactate/ureidoglycolate dehydrogenase